MKLSSPISSSQISASQEPQHNSASQVIDEVLCALKAPQIARGSLLLFGLAGAAAGISGCAPPSSHKPGNPEVRTIASLPSDYTLEGLVYPDGDTIFIAHHNELNFGNVLDTPDQELAPGPMFADWTDMRMAGNFNCHSFTLGQDAGLTPQDWINGKANDLCNYHNSVKDALERFFVKAAEIVLDDSSHLGGIKFDNLEDGDRVFLVKGNGDSLDYVHSGIFLRSGNGGVMAHKQGGHPVMICHIDEVLALYEGQFERIEVYRPKVARSLGPDPL